MFTYHKKEEIRLSSIESQPKRVVVFVVDLVVVFVVVGVVLVINIVGHRNLN